MEEKKNKKTATTAPMKISTRTATDTMRPATTAQLWEWNNETGNNGTAMRMKQWDWQQQHSYENDNNGTAMRMKQWDWQQRHSYENDNNSTAMRMTTTAQLWEWQQRHSYENDNNSTAMRMTTTAQLWEWQQRHSYENDNNSTATTILSSAHSSPKKKERLIDSLPGNAASCWKQTVKG